MTSTDTVRDQLAEAVVAGRPLDLPTGDAGGRPGPLPDSVMRGWGPGHDLTAGDLFDLLHGRGLPDDAAPHPTGVQLRGARITGRLVLDFVTDVLPLRLIDCLLVDGINAYAAHLPQLELRRCRISHTTRIPLHAENAQIDHDLRLVHSVVIAPDDAHSAVDLTGARIGHALTCHAATLTHQSGSALIADGCTIGGDMFFTGGFQAHGAGDRGAVRLLGAQITGQLNADGALLTNNSGPALTADRCTTGDDMFLTDGFQAHGAGDRGAVRLLGAQITGQLNADGAVLANDSGPALIASRCTIGGSMFLTGGFRAYGAGDRGAVRLYDAQITGQLDLRGATVTSTASTALDLNSAQVSGSVFLDGGFSARADGPDPARGNVVELTRTQVGSLHVNDGVTHVDDPQRRWQLDGCTYTGLPTPDNRQWWMHLLRDATPTYAAQPYQQLAVVHRAAGHDRDVREILIAQRRDQIRRGRLTRPQKTWARFTGVVLGFGWKPWRALYGLAAVFTVSIVLALVLGANGGLVHPPQPGRPPEPCTTLERIGAGLDLGTPLLSTVTRARDRCPINPDPTSTAAEVLTVSTWILQFTAWALAALFVAGFTGAVRKT